MEVKEIATPGVDPTETVNIEPQPVEDPTETVNIEPQPVEESDELAAFVSEAQATAPKEKKKGRKKKEKAEGEETEKAEKKVREAKPRRDNVGLVTQMNSISRVRKFIQIANAKKAKTSPDKTESQERYDKEIAAGKDQLNNLLSLVADSSDKVSKLVELDEEPNRIVTAVILDVETDFGGWIERIGAKEPSKAMVRKADDSLPESFLARFGANFEDFKDTVEDRYNRSDFRLRAACRMINFKAMYDAGSVKWADGKWSEVVPA